MLTIQPLTGEGVAACAANLRADDVAELEAAGLTDIVAVMDAALPACLWAELALWRDQPIAMFGVRALPGGEVGVPWMISTETIDTAERAAVARAGARAVRRMQADFEILTNMVHASNATAIRFIEWLGFTVLDDLSGPGKQFRQFFWRRDDGS